MKREDDPARWLAQTLDRERNDRGMAEGRRRTSAVQMADFGRERESAGTDVRRCTTGPSDGDAAPVVVISRRPRRSGENLVRGSARGDTAAV